MSSPNGPSHVMVVDDDKDMLSIFRHILGAAGYRTTLLDDPLAFEETFDADRPDILILDVVMPWRDGIEIARSLEDTNPSLPIIIASGFGSPYTSAVSKLANLEGGRLVLTIKKPFTKAQLLDALSRCASIATSTRNPDEAGGREAQTRH